MKISEAKSCIRELYLHTGCVTALVSERGVGKTSAYRQCAQELEIGYIGLYAAALEGPDFMGLPDRDRETGVTRYLAPQFLPTRQAVAAGLYPEKGLLVLEEINRVPSDTVSVLYPLLLEKKINGHELGAGWAIGVTMNPDTMNYLVNARDDAMLDRFVSIWVDADLEDYIAYSQETGPDEGVLAFLRACPDMLLVTKKAADSTALYKSPTPRGWTKVQELRRSCAVGERLMRELVAGVVGPQAAAAFYGFLQDRGPAVPAARTVLGRYENARDGVRALVMQNRMDALSGLVRRAAGLYSGQDAQTENAAAFAADLPGELRVLFFKTLSARSEELTACFEHTAVFASVAGIMADALGTSS